MTDSMKCPFCGQELQTDNEIARLILWRCHTPGCLLNGWHSAEIIQHLIDGKNARDALNYAIGVLDNLTEIGGVDMEIIKIKKMAGIK